MKSATPEQFARTPIGRYVIGRSYCVGCWDSKLRFAALWGRPDEDDARAMTMLLEVVFHDEMSPPLMALTDVTGIEQVDPLAFRFLADYLSRRKRDFDRVLGRQALVRPKEGAVAALIAGFYETLGERERVRSFTNYQDAFTWLGRSGDALDLASALPSLVADASGSASLLSTVRRILDEEPRISLPEIARRLGTTPRGLQRQLQELQPPRRFRQEAVEAKVRVAERLLRDGTLKVGAIASRVGIPLGKLRHHLRASAGKTPNAIRAEALDARAKGRGRKKGPGPKA